MGAVPVLLLVPLPLLFTAVPFLAAWAWTDRCGRMARLAERISRDILAMFESNSEGLVVLRFAGMGENGRNMISLRSAGPWSLCREDEHDEEGGDGT